MRHRTPNPQPHSIQMHNHIVFKCAIHKEQGHLIDEGAPDHKLATILGTLHQHFRPLQLVSGKSWAIPCFTNYHPPALHSSLSPSTFLPFPLAFLLTFPPPFPFPFPFLFLFPFLFPFPFPFPLCPPSPSPASAAATHIAALMTRPVGSSLP